MADGVVVSVCVHAIAPTLVMLQVVGELGSSNSNGNGSTSGYIPGAVLDCLLGFRYFWVLVGCRPPGFRVAFGRALFDNC